MLRRLAYPNRLVDLRGIFGKSAPDLSQIFNKMIEIVFANFKDLLTSFDHFWLDGNHLQLYADATKDKGSPLQNCVGFIDGKFTIKIEDPQKYTFSIMPFITF